MPVTNAPTEIVNLALDTIKTENINDIEIPGSDKIAGTCSRWYDDTRQNCLEGFPWIFASERANIPLNAEAPAFGFTDAYVLPNNYLSLNFIQYQELPLSQWNYVIEQGNIFIDYDGAETLPIGYTFDQTDVSKWSPSFKFFVAASLAERIVYKLTGNAGLHGRVAQVMKTAEIGAKAKNGKANPPIAFRQSKMLNARRVYSSTPSPFGRPRGRA
jgi:hypothetical protein